MAETHDHEHDHESSASTGTANSILVSGAIAGLGAGIVMGAMLQMQMTAVIEMAIPALYGTSGQVAGWVAHLVHSVVFGVVFALGASAIPALGDRTESVTMGAGIGILYGVVLWVVAAAFVMPVWLDAVGFAGAPSVPNFNTQSLVGHAVYGVVLGGLFAALRSR